MSQSAASDPDPYTPDHRLSHTYDEATLLDEEGLEALCPSYIELSEVEARYRDEALLGQGAVKDVYRTYDNRTKRWVAMARLRGERGPEYYDLFVHEAWLTSSLSHPNIIKIYDTGVDSEGRPFFTMDLKGNTSLANLAHHSNKTPLRELLEVFIKVCDAVAYAHSRGVIHLDLKPDNIQTDSFGEVLVCDWGLGKVIGESEDGEDQIPETLTAHDNMTLLGQVKGTPGFMAPEQAGAEFEKDRRTDVFSLGCILHFILTGKPPFTGAVDKVLDATLRSNVPPLRLRFPHLNIPESLEAVVLKATSRLPEERYQSALSFRNEIDQFLGGFSTQAEQPGFIRETRLFFSRHRTPCIITILSALVLAILSVLFVRKLDRQAFAANQIQLRADQFETKATTLESDYQSLVTQSEHSKEELAAELAQSANSLKNLGIFKRPDRTVTEAQNLASTALALDPNCEKAHFERFSLNCIILNFQGALEDPLPANHFHSRYLRFAEAFPDFAFSSGNRPSPKKLVTFFRRARTIDSKSPALMERILSYDFATRRDHSFDDQILGAFLENLNGGKEHLSASYDQDKSSYLIRSSRNTRLIVPPNTGASGECVLRFLHFRTLKLEISGNFSIADLQLLPIEVLDLRDCDNLSIDQAVSLPRLREIHLRPGQVDKDLLRRRIQTSEPLQIVEKP
ncbi:serine/threonine protein kinase [Haloferula sp.]|uniref:serine/threonine protein kinase n=1 Tax=Haloferula sp. TaxID=2497595 RepID=UPI00329C93AA